MRWKIGRTICLVIGVALLGVSVRLGWFSFDWDRRFETWVSEVPARFTLDPSSTKEVAATLHHTCEVGHSQQILLRVLEKDGTAAPEEFWPKRVDASIFVDALGGAAGGKKSDGAAATVEVESSARDYDLEPAMEEGQGLVIARPRFGREGEYRLRFKLNTAIDVPPGMVYEISVRNLLCGMERMPGTVAGIVAVVCGLVGLVFAVPAGMLVLRRG